LPSKKTNSGVAMSTSFLQKKLSRSERQCTPRK
jgi:hypothetical protein